jgi:hypothetical protein
MKKNKRFIKLSIIFIFLIFCLVFWTSSLISVNKAKAIDAVMGPEINVSDYSTWEMVFNVWDEIIANEKTRIAEKKADESKQTLGSKLFQSTFGNALKKIAYDTATWLGSGGKGQQPLFITEGWGEYLTNIGDEAAGDLLETLGKENGFVEFNLCKPNFEVGMRIGLGLVNQQRPKKPACTFTEMKDNWEEELSSGDFLTKFQDMFDPKSNDLGIALMLHTGMEQVTDAASERAILERTEAQGWLDIRDISGNLEGLPNLPRMEAENMTEDSLSNYVKFTGSITVDAANIFVNQLALTLMQTLLREMQGKPSTQPYDWSKLTMFEAGPHKGGVTEAKERFNKIIEPVFNERGDYDILNELSTCPDPNNAGPTNCVIDSRFSRAIAEKITVHEAMDQGYLNPEAIFGFNSQSKVEPEYNQGYPYRSMKILRKFRIIPVGWELAAQYILDNQEVFNLGDMVSCFDPEDDYDTYDADWCRGLVDPNWVLKAPANYCKREGPGPEILSAQVSGREENSRLSIMRNENYCSDEQACIKEYSDGSCQYYGYCTEEKRGWKFDGESCDPIYNTCQTFRNSEGQTVSYLENSLDYGICSLDNVGCQRYSNSFPLDSYDKERDIIDWNEGSGMYFDQDAEECSEDSEGCHEFIRTTSGLGINLLTNASFEEIADGDEIDPLPLPGTEVIDTFEGWPANIGYAVSDPYSGAIGVYVNVDSITRVVDLDPMPLEGETFTLSIYTNGCATGTIHLGSDEAAIAAETSVASADLNTSIDGWARTVVSYTFSLGEDTDLAFELRDIDGCRLDAVMLERGSLAAPFVNYRGRGVVYSRFLPDYLLDLTDTSGIKGPCYEVDSNGFYQLAPDAPAICSQFSRKCNILELGCNLYTAVKDGFTVSAKVKAWDYCPAECVGYDDYYQTETTFASPRMENIIPENSARCSAQSVGCEEFTNLDKVGDKNPDQYGAEDREYFRYMRQCRLPDREGAAVEYCGRFYTWEGSSESGYQLKVHYFLKEAEDRDDDGALGPEVVNYNGTDYYNDVLINCNERVYNLPADHEDYNSDCREFYNDSGQLSYREYSQTIMCTDNCHPYRMSRKNIVKESDNTDIDDEGDCEDQSVFTDIRPGINEELYEDVHWDNDAGQCILCKGRGRYDEDQGACIYMAVPDQGIRCSANHNGCKEYTGPAGNNINILTTYDFEGSIQGWRGADFTPETDNESLMVGGESLYVEGPTDHEIYIPVNNMVNKGKAYYLSFIAKARTTNGTFSVWFNNGTESAFFSREEHFGMEYYPGQWMRYQMSLENVSLDHDITENEKLYIRGNVPFFIDNIRLTEITDRYYLIEDSWNIPETCTRDIYGTPDELVNLGCEAYNDMDGETAYIWQFSSLCHESAAGCDLMIDTHNYSDYHAEAWLEDIATENDSCAEEGEDCVEVPGDNYVLAVYNPERSCLSGDLGCERLGYPYKYTNQFVYEDVYMNNNPNEYYQILCREEAVGCLEWSRDEGMSYFKDPGDMICVYEQRPGDEAAGWKWYKKKVKRCDDGVGTDSVAGDGIINGDETTGTVYEENICLTSKDCMSAGVCTDDADCGPETSCVDGACHFNCIEDQNYYECWTGVMETIGYGGPGTQVEQPTNDGLDFWAGICPAKMSGCTEYIDPISQFSQNLLFNPTLENIDGVDPPVDGWYGTYNQDVTVDRYQLYRLAGRSEDLSLTANISINCIGDIGADNLGRLDTTVNEMINEGSNAFNDLAITGIGWESVLIYTNANNRCTVTLTLGGGMIHEVEMKKAIVDYQLRGEVKEDCNGIVEFENGCVLFNERTQDGFAKNQVIYDADTSPGGEDQSAVTGCNLDPAAGFNCDSNRLLKVRPDRDCAKWLDCETFGIADNGDVICHDINLCTSLNPNGQCSGFVDDEEYFNVNYSSNQIYDDNISLTDIHNMTGYSVVKHELNITFSEPYDLYPLSVMPQFGGIIEDYNFSFEDYSFSEDYEEEQGGNPDNWAQGDLLVDWNPSFFSVVTNPVTTQNLSLTFRGDIYAPDGRAFLRYSSSNATSSPHTFTPIDVDPDTEYMISAWFNTSKLRPVDGVSDVVALLRIIPLDSDGNELTDIVGIEDLRYGPDVPGGPEETRDIIKAQKGQDWKQYVNRFKTQGLVDNIQLHLLGYLDGAGDCEASTTQDNCIGDVYVDHIMIKPALNKREITGVPEDEYAVRECRLFPESDSLACEYYEDSGIKQKGWWGYCLEHDHYPGDPAACLLWWPVDRIWGDGIGIDEEIIMGYDSRIPLYYCLDSEPETIYVYRHAFYREFHCEGGSCGSGCPPGYRQEQNDDCDSCATVHDREICYCIPICDPSDTDAILDGNSNARWGCNGGDGYDNPTSQCDGWYPISSTDTQVYRFSTRGGHGRYYDFRAYDWEDGDIKNGGIRIPADHPNADYLCIDSPQGAPPCNLRYPLIRLASNPNFTFRDPDNDPDFLYTITDQLDLPRLTVVGAPNFTVTDPPYYCNELIQTVNDFGDNQFWAARVYNGSQYWDNCNEDNPLLPKQCYYGDDYYPFGSVVQPEPLSNPSLWDSKELDDSDSHVKQPLFWEEPDTGLNAPFQPRMGQQHSPTSTMRLFAQSHQGGSWYWHFGWSQSNTNPLAGGYYDQPGGESWMPPNTICPDTDGDLIPDRPRWEPDTGLCNGGSCFVGCPGGNTCDYCAIKPEIRNIKVNNTDGIAIVDSGSSAELSFNTIVDNQQLPLVQYDIAWGDNETGTPHFQPFSVSILNKPNEDDPHIETHTYDHQQLSQRFFTGTLDPSNSDTDCRNDCTDLVAEGCTRCAGEQCCIVVPRIKIEDNWGWCQNGVDGTPCPANPATMWQEFPNRVIILP